MSSQFQIDQIADRVERLLYRYAELQQHHAELARELQQAREQRDALSQRLQTATARLDALLEQLPLPVGDAQ